MKLLGFGCSFTYGSELQSPDVDPEDHWGNTRYRNEHSWLGLLAKRLDCEYDNLAQPANSNFAIAQQVADYVLNTLADEPVTICVGWTERTRMSWLGEGWTHNNGQGFTWTHNGFVTAKTGWTASAKEWVLNSTDRSHQAYTDNAKLMVNSICAAQGIPILQFNAIGRIHPATTYPNYYIDGSTMDSMLKRAAQDDERLDLFAEGGHPNEAGHEYFTKRLYLFAKERIINV